MRPALQGPVHARQPPAAAPLQPRAVRAERAAHRQEPDAHLQVPLLPGGGEGGQPQAPGVPAGGLMWLGGGTGGLTRAC